MHIFKFTLPILQFDSRIFLSYPLSGGYSMCLKYSYIWDWTRVHETNPRTSFQIGGLRVSETRVMSFQGTRVKPHTPTSYPWCHTKVWHYHVHGTSRVCHGTHIYFKLGGWVENLKIQVVLFQAPPSSILLSDLNNEQIRNPRKGLLLSLLLKSRTRLQHLFVWHVSNSRVLNNVLWSFGIANW